MIEVVALGSEHLKGFERLFHAAGSTCFCRYWHFRGTKNEWLERCALRPEENLAEQAAAVQKLDPTGLGLVALDRSCGGVLVGWMKLSRCETVPKLRSLPVYKHLAVEPGTWTIGCFLVHPDHRRRGVARQLVQGGMRHAASAGAQFLEAHPRRDAVPLHDEEAWQGPERVFVELGFAAVHDVAPYPVYRIRV